VARLVEAWTGAPPDESVRTAAAAAGQRARHEIGGQVRALLAADINAQRTTPLAIVRTAVDYPAEVLRAAGVPRVVYFSGLGVARYGMAPRTTDRYFLSKLRAEAALFASGLEVLVFRPSYIVGPRDGLVSSLLRQMAAGEVGQVGDGAYRMQPVAVRDAAAAVVAGISGPTPAPAPGRGPHRVIDLVGPQAITFQHFVEALAAAARAQRRPAEFRVRTIPVEEADRRAREGRGMPPEELDCLLCDEIGDARPLEALLGRFLTSLEEALAAAVRGTPPEKRPATPR